nr:MAG: RNA-dependent RNA polymerase [Hangzhou virga-like virus]
MSPTQFIAGAVQCGAEVAFAFFPYHPVMLMQESGEIPGTGVYFHKDFEMGELRLRYPEGVCGAEVFSLNDWGAWLTEHVVQVGRGERRMQYHFQLIKRRGPFMLVQATRAGTTLSQGIKLRHCLDLEMPEQMYVIESWKLKNVAANPNVLSSWRQVSYLAPRKIVDAVYTFGMQLSPENFSRYAIRRQLTMYDRVTVEGSNVVMGYMPSADELDALTTDLYAELFAKRFESGLLSKELMARLKAVSGFSNAPFSSRVKVIATWCMVSVWENSFGRLFDAVASVAKWVEDCFTSSVDKLPGPQFAMAPTKLTFETVVDRWRKVNRTKYAKALQVATRFRPGNVTRIRGGLLADAIAVRERSYATTAVDSSFVHVGHVVLQDGLASKAAAGEVLTTEAQQELVDLLKEQNTFDQASDSRHVMPTEAYVRMDDPDDGTVVDQDIDPDYIGTLNEVYEGFNPGVPASKLERDIASLSLDPQDRQLYAERLRYPRVFAAQPRDRKYFRSKVLALGAPKRQETGPELLSAMAARNLAAPRVKLVQDDSVIIPQIWENFLKTMCVPDAKEKLARYQRDPVALEENAYIDWMSQSRPDVVNRVAAELKECDVPMLEQDVGTYLSMLKADVKPPLSDKPLKQRIEPQVIVYHSKGLSSMYSSVFRVLVRRLLSLLRPNVHVNLLKDMDDIKRFLQAVHPFDADLKYIENDFSKYDKSQDAFVFKLEQYVFEALGMNQALLERWVKGHEQCRLFSFTTGISLHLRFQRKSGDATTSFGNVLLNIMSVSYAYGLSEFAWALFMGDDSLVATSVTTVDEKAVAILAEVFNLTAKTFVTDQPYFASWFFIFLKERRRVIGLPDPIKRIEKLSQAVSAIDPQWSERFISAAQTCAAYANKSNTKWLGAMVAKRYQIPVQAANRLPAAVYTACSSEANFRALYEDEPEDFLI